MIEKIKKRWNMLYTNSAFFLLLAMIASGVNNDLDKSLMYFGVSMVMMGLGEMINEIRKLHKDNK